MSALTSQRQARQVLEEARRFPGVSTRFVFDRVADRAGWSHVMRRYVWREVKVLVRRKKTEWLEAVQGGGPGPSLGRT